MPGVVSNQEVSANALISAGISRIPAMHYDTENLTRCVHMSANVGACMVFNKLLLSMAY